MQLNRTILSLVALVFITGCEMRFANVPPNDIGMMLTPTGYENKVYSPGQVNIGKEDTDGEGNKLVLIQRSGIEVKEQFIGAAGSEDKEDHRCLTRDNAPMTLDVRLMFALPDYEKPEGMKDLNRIFQLGNPQEIENGPKEMKGRVLRISGESIYADQARQQVRGRIRQICSVYENFDAAFIAASGTGPKSMTRHVEEAVASILREKQVPLRLLTAYVSNMKPDSTVMDAISAKKAAEKRVEAISELTKFLSEDSTGVRWKVYQMQVLQEIVSTANTNGHNTIYMVDVGGANGVQPPIVMPTAKRSVDTPAEKPTDK